MKLGSPLGRGRGQGMGFSAKQNFFGPQALISGEPPGGGSRCLNRSLLSLSKKEIRQAEMVIMKWCDSEKQCKKRLFCLLSTFTHAGTVGTVSPRMVLWPGLVGLVLTLS